MHFSHLCDALYAAHELMAPAISQFHSDVKSNNTSKHTQKKTSRITTKVYICTTRHAYISMMTDGISISSDINRYCIIDIRAVLPQYGYAKECAFASSTLLLPNGTLIVLVYQRYRF